MLAPRTETVCEPANRERRLTLAHPSGFAWVQDCLVVSLTYGQPEHVLSSAGRVRRADTKGVCRYGLRDGGDMHLHHAATLALIVLSYTLNGAHVGAYIMALLNASNPLLHASKLANEQVTDHWLAMHMTAHMLTPSHVAVWAAALLCWSAHCKQEEAL